jgi:diaminopimelate dehydrogenase
MQQQILPPLQKIRIGLAGYGNLGRGLEKAVALSPDLELSVILTRREPSSLQILSAARVARQDDAAAWRDKVDVMVLCGGSATDLPEQGPKLAKLFNTVDSFDTHARIPEYFSQVNAAALAGGNLALISCGWDPGLFSLIRALLASVLPVGQDCTFWGKGVSQGHSDAIRRIPGVVDARQYTIPIESALAAARAGQGTPLGTRQKHQRECYVAVAPDADRAAIEKAIVTMPNYFADYDTTVTFISQEEMLEKHAGLPHGGFVIRNGMTSANVHQVAEFSLQLDSNPDFTGSVLAAYARAVCRLARNGRRGAVSIFDVPVAELSPLDPVQLRHDML